MGPPTPCNHSVRQGGLAQPQKKKKKKPPSLIVEGEALTQCLDGTKGNEEVRFFY